MPRRPGPELRIDLLGGFRVATGEVAAGEAAWRLGKARGLLKLLALTPEHSLHREEAIEALWPGRAPTTASNNLRQALFVTRWALDCCGDDGGARVTLTHDVLTLGTDRLRIDVELFEAAAAAAERAPSVLRHRAAIDLYGGELLPQDRFDGWAMLRREALRDRHLTLLVDLAGLHATAGDGPAAVAALQQALLEEPLHERAHRELMRIYALTGRRQRALAQFHLLRETLRREFEDEPDDHTRGLYQDILTRRLGADGTPEPAPAGRRAGGAWLAELAGLSDGTLVPHAVAATPGVESRSARPSEEAVAAHPGEREMLLVLDNCVHLVGAGVDELTDGVIDAILSPADGVPAPLGQLRVHQLGGR